MTRRMTRGVFQYLSYQADKRYSAMNSISSLPRDENYDQDAFLANFELVRSIPDVFRPGVVQQKKRRKRSARSDKKNHYSIPKKLPPTLCCADRLTEIHDIIRRFHTNVTLRHCEINFNDCVTVTCDMCTCAKSETSDEGFIDLTIEDDSI